MEIGLSRLFAEESLADLPAWIAFMDHLVPYALQSRELYHPVVWSSCCGELAMGLTRLGVSGLRVSRYGVSPSARLLRTFTTTPRAAQISGQSQDGRTTHFGFETVEESAKQQRGLSMILYMLQEAMV